MKKLDDECSRGKPNEEGAAELGWRRSVNTVVALKTINEWMAEDEERIFQLVIRIEVRTL